MKLVGFFCVFVGVWLPLKTAAQSEAVIANLRDCLLQVDRAFETSLDPGLAEADLIRLRGIVNIGVTQCGSWSIQSCNNATSGDRCFDDLGSFVDGHRLAILEVLPGPDDDHRLDTRGYALAFREAHGVSAELPCDSPPISGNSAYCAVFGGVLALEYTYQVWRMARRRGVAPLVGGEPVNLEILR